METQNKTRLPAAFISLGQRNYRLFWSGELVSLIGLWMQMIAQGWLVYDMTGSKFLLGAINAIAGLPVLFLTPLGGIIADHVNKKKLLLTTQIIFGSLSFLIGTLISLKLISFWSLGMIVFFLGVTNAIDSPTRQAFVIDLVKDKRILGNAIALNSLAFNAARVIGPAIAGFLIGALGVEACYFINAASFIAVIVGLLLVKGDFSAKAEMNSNVGRALLDGLKYVAENKKILSALMLIAFSSLFIMPYAVLMPVFAKDIFRMGPQGLGILMSFSGFGAFVGAFMLAQYSWKIDFRQFNILSTLILCVSIILFAVSRNFLFSCLMLSLLGWGIVSQAASVNTFIQHEVPDHLRGRVMGFYIMSFMGLMPIGAFQAGVVSHFIGASAALVIGGIACLIPVLTMIKTR